MFVCVLGAGSEGGLQQRSTYIIYRTCQATMRLRKRHISVTCRIDAGWACLCLEPQNQR